MGRCLPVFLAFVLNSLGIFIFTTPKTLDCLPYLSYVIFLLGVFFLLWDIELRPCSLRRLYACAEIMIEFAVSMLLMEIIMNNFWFPLEIGFISFLPKITDFVTDTAYKYGYSCSVICDALDVFKWPSTLLLASYSLSIFFFLSIVHATRMVDFRLLMVCGPRVFFCDAVERTKKFWTRTIRKVFPSFGVAQCPNAKKVTIEPRPRRCHQRRASGNLSEEEMMDDWDEGDFDPNDYCNCECGSHSSD